MIKVLNFALDVYIPAVYPAGPEPIIIISKRLLLETLEARDPSSNKLRLNILMTG